MAITSLMTKDELGRDISIDPDKVYSKKGFLEGAGDYILVRDSLNELVQNTGNYTAKKTLAGLLSPSNPLILLNRDSGVVVEAVGLELKAAGTNLARFTEKNHLEQKLDGEQCSALILSLANPEDLRLYNKSPSDKKLLEIITRQHYIATGKLEGLRADIPDLVKKMPVWHQALFSISQSDQRYMADFLKSYTGIISAKYDQAFKTRDKYSKTKLLGVYSRSLAQVRAEMKGKSKDKREEIWEEKIKPVQLITAETLFRALK